VAAALGADALELRARHLELADSPDAPAAYREAAEKLYFEHRYEAALGLVESALSLSPGGRTLVDLMMIKAEILGLLGRYADARDLFAHTGEVCDDDATRCQCLVKAAENGCRLEEFPPALDRLAQAEALAARLALNRLLSDIHFRRGEIHYMLSDFDRCLQDQEKAYELANLSGSFEALSHAFQGMGFVHYQRGRILTSQGYFERCVEHARRSDQERLAVQILHMTGYGRYAALDLEGALRIGREAVASGERIGCRRTVMNAGRLCAYILLEMGRLDESRAMLETSLAIASAITARRYEPILNAVLARIHALQGECARAVDLAERACHDSLSSNASYMGPSVLGTLAVVSPDPSRQDWALQQGLRLLSSESPSHNHLWFHRDAITVAIRRGLDDMARRHARCLEDYTWSESLPWATFHVEKGRWLGRTVAGERTIEVRDVLRRLERQAVQTGLAMEGAEIRSALERHWAG
jgi:tetratricopeptide (TPR) repeat protein